VEFALVLPLFLMLVFGIIDIGRYVFTLNTLNQVARESARVGSVQIWPAECAALQRDSCIERIARGRAVGVGLNAGLVTTAGASSAGVQAVCRHLATNGTQSVVAFSNCKSTDLLTVTLHSDFTLVTPVIGQFIQQVNLTGEAQVAVNN
jgi:Flp pilus assembly protein TadG